MTKLEIGMTNSAMCRQIMKITESLVPTNMKMRWCNDAHIAIEYEHPVVYTWNEEVKVGLFKKELIPKPHESTTQEYVFIDTNHEADLLPQVKVSSEDPCMDEIAKKMAVEISHYFTVKLYLAKYSDELPHGLKCQYCGQYTHDTEQCEHCGGVPL